MEAEMRRIVALLRSKIRRSGFTQRQVEESLGWGRGRIWRLAKKPRSFRLKPLLLVLGVIGVEPAEFFRELYGDPTPPGDASEWPALPQPSPRTFACRPRRTVDE